MDRSLMHASSMDVALPRCWPSRLLISRDPCCDCERPRVSDSIDTFGRHRIRGSETQTENPPGDLRSDRPSSVHRARAGAAVFGFALPVCAYFWLIHQYGANLLWHDQWDDINLISHSYSHTLGLGTLWAQHNENRIFFPNLIVLILARTTQFNVLAEEYLGGLMLVLATGILILAHRRRSPSTPWIYYCPIAILMLSLVNIKNALLGFSDGLVPRDGRIGSRPVSVG